MKKTSLFQTIVFTFLIVITGAVWAADDARVRLNGFFTKVNSLEGSFNQQVFSKKGKLIQTSSGLIYLNRPGKFRWVYKTPDPQTIVSDGRNIWVYDEDLEQVTIKPMDTSLSSTPISILTRKQSPDVQFVVKPMNVKAGGLDWFQLTPRIKSRDFKQIEIGLDNTTMRQMNMLDQLGQKTVVRLNVNINTAIDSQLFTFKIPEGVDVIGNEM